MWVLYCPPPLSTFESDNTCFHLLTSVCDSNDLLAKLDALPPLFKLDDYEVAPIVANLACTLESSQLPFSQYRPL
ncbi:hypothetical protein GOP47_0031087 [Adiantum capillus-veneris]|nr:hypothetical protein GOP47_0031087 [Adiantum capillus-veneris]